MDVVNECLRFKRRILADLVKKYLGNIAKDIEVR